MTVKEMLRRTGMTQDVFAGYFGVPQSLVGDWASGAAELPEYLARLMEYKLNNEKLFRKMVFAVSARTKILRYIDFSHMPTTEAGLLQNWEGHMDIFGNGELVSYKEFPSYEQAKAYFNSLPQKGGLGFDGTFWCVKITVADIEEYSVDKDEVYGEAVILERGVPSFDTYYRWKLEAE